MARLLSTILLAGAAFQLLPVQGYVWPDDKIDELEFLLYEQSGARIDNPALQVTNCHGIVGGEGRSIGAEWIRNAYHDMATADVAAGTGGIDASIGYEMDRPENAGNAFKETIQTVTPAATTRSSIADLVALAAVFAIGACSNGSVLVPFRGGRIEATGPGPEGVPEPQQDLSTHTEKFARQGFTASEMIGLVACGHSVGGVHGVDFPTIVDVVNTTDFDENTIGFDTTRETFDNNVATEFVANVSQNPLAFGHNETTRSDFRIFNSDGGSLIRQMAESSEFFFQTCQGLFERMINTVPKEVTLTDVIAPIPVKPRVMGVEVNDNGTLTVWGTLRIDKTLVTADPTVLVPSAQVLVHVKPRSGETCSTTQPCAVAIGTTDEFLKAGCIYPNCGPDWQLYDFSALVPAEQGVSALTVEIVDGDTGSSVIYDNSGHGFPIAETLQPQAHRTCVNYIANPDGTFSQQQNLTVALLNAEGFTEVSLVVQNRQTQNNIMPGFIPATIPMARGDTVTGTNYTLFNVLWIQQDSHFVHPFDLIATGPGITVENNFNKWAPLTAGICN